MIFRFLNYHLQKYKINNYFIVIIYLFIIVFRRDNNDFLISSTKGIKSRYKPEAYAGRVRYFIAPDLKNAT